ncbi:efflux RND transporter periplasmic adaptor subunit [Vibrio hannami]|uniref:efflux RND transporter periplasmic adaptor subunit n=1 Tax=Vibrio hannami TaxID=2717094 RepID=UPI0024101C9B|nr:efflux RND transporter periplasmic adaptor subunit [Vibrio hannami]MDG3085776.1 efflux RND transporter periplasmic adaptor subunit [Vibrio hannami]
MKLNTITIAITLLSASAIFGAAAYNGSKMPEKGKPGAKPESVVAKPAKMDVVTILQQIAVQETTPSSYQSEVVGYGEVHSKYELTYTSEVSGRVKNVSENFESGMVVKKGTVLAYVDDTSYQQAVAQAKASVAQAKLDYLEEQRQGEQAKLEWQRSGLSGEPDSPLVLRKPQLENTKATLENAQQELKKALQDLSNTVIKAPFDALVVTRDVQPGSYVQAGTQVATLYSIDSVEVEIPLSDEQWSSLPVFDNELLKQDKWPVTLTTSDLRFEWQGYVVRTEKHLSTETRQRSLVVAVDSPLEKGNNLYPGTFVKATIEGQSLEGLWELPSSAISQQGNIWLVNENGLLNSISADVKFAKQDSVYVTPAFEGSVKIAKRPLSSFQNNMKVQPVIEGSYE